MIELRQRQPRERDEKHLDFIRSLPCCICGDDIHTEAAHIRAGSIENGKVYTGIGEKPSDAWVLPLCNGHHREQHSMNEMKFWEKYEINPFLLAISLQRPK